MSLCRELGQAGRLGWCAGCGGMLEGLVASKVSLVAVVAWAAAGGAGSGYAAGMREAWGRLQAAIAGHLSDADARMMEREAEAMSGSQKELMAFLDQANDSRHRK
eukprot:jgi/Tetstr1/455656/TSEL_042467.t1